MFTKRRTSPKSPAGQPSPDKARPGKGQGANGHEANGGPHNGASSKGRPTPTRKQAEQARRERLKYGSSSTRRGGAAGGKGGRKGERSERQRMAVRQRDALRSGDEANYPERDRGPVKRFCRDYVDSRHTIGEILIPLMVVVIAFSFIRNTTILTLTPAFTAFCLVLLAADLLRLRFGLRRELAKRFPGESTAGAMGYTLMRATQMRFLRLPKPRVKPGTKI